MKINRFYFYLFAVAFFAFAVAFVNFVNYSMTDEEGGSRYWLTRIAFFMDVLCVFIMILRLRRKYNGIHLICMLWLLIMPINMLLNHAPLYDIIRTIIWPLLFETTYLCCQNCISRGLFLKKEFFVLAIIGAYYFLATRVGIEHQTNTVYFVFLTMPWLLFESKKVTRLIIVLVFTSFAVLSLKRSMLLTTILIWGFYFLTGLENRRNRIITIIGVLVMMVSFSVLYDKVDESLGGLLSERVNREETNSGRDRMAIWTLTWNMIQNSPTEKIMIGHGHFGVRNDSFLEISAHNDFLEVIYDYGIIILILYLGLWIYVIRRSVYLYKIKSPLFFPYASALSIFLVMSLVSHLLLYTTYFNYLVLFWGATEAIVEYNKKQIV
jgi:hypothetical protein